MSQKNIHIYVLTNQRKYQIIRPIEMSFRLQDNLKHIISYLFERQFINLKNVKVSFKQGGTKLSQFITVKDMSSILEDKAEQNITLFITKNEQSSNNIELLSVQRTSPTYFQKPQSNNKIKQIRQVVYIPNNQSLTNIQQSPIQQRIDKQEDVNGPIKKSRKSKKKIQQPKDRLKDICCLLM